MVIRPSGREYSRSDRACNFKVGLKSYEDSLKSYEDSEELLSHVHAHCISPFLSHVR